MILIHRICIGFNGFGRPTKLLIATKLRAATLVLSWNVRKFLMLKKMDLPSSMAFTIVLKSSSVITMAAASFATSVPDPMAMPEMIVMMWFVIVIIGCSYDGDQQVLQYKIIYVDDTNHTTIITNNRKQQHRHSPMSAAFNAGASLTPSPVMATTLPRSCNARTIDNLWRGDVR